MKQFVKSKALKFFGILLVLVIGLTIYKLIEFNSLKIACQEIIWKEAGTINVYFKRFNADRINDVFRQDLTKINGVKNVKYISPDNALNAFKQYNADDASTLQALDELTTNPFGSSFVLTFTDVRALAANEETVIKNIRELTVYHGLPTPDIESKAAQAQYAQKTLDSYSIFSSNPFGGYNTFQILKNCVDGRLY